MNLTALAVELLDQLPANRTLGLTVQEVHKGVGRAVLPVSERVHNVIGSLHSSGVAALADAAALAAILSLSPEEGTARRLLPLGARARLRFRSPIRGIAVAICDVDPDGRSALDGLFSGRDDQARFTTLTTIDGDQAPRAAEGEFDWVIRLAQR